MTKAALIATLFLLACRFHIDSPAVAAAANGDLTILQRLLEQGTEANRADRHRVTPLIAAARSGQVGAIRFLIARGADPDLHDGRSTRWNPLMHAIHKNQRDAVMALLEGGANADDRSAAGSTPLVMAAGYGNTEMVELLLRHGADPRLQSRDGVTALAAAVEGVPDIDCFTVGSCQTDTVRAILRHDSNAPMRAVARRARWIARLGGCSEVLRLVERRG